VVCLDQTGIVAGLSGFFSQRGVDIAELSTRSYAAAHTGAPMFSVQMIVNVPSRLHIGVFARRVHGFLRPSELGRHFRTRKELNQLMSNIDVGKKAPPFALEGTGGSWSLSDGAGNPVVIYSTRATTRRAAPRRAKILPQRIRSSRRPRP